jgi:hypothetical protein
LKLKVGAQHYNFVTRSGLGGDAVEVYAPAEAIAKFVANDITDQAFLDLCIVLMNNVRTRVVLG